MKAQHVCAETRGEPATFLLGQAGSLIDCWNMAVPTFHVGDTALITCASAYAYGDRGYPPSIPASATIRFRLSVISVEAPSGGHDEL
jgi:FKBP-type peptidyl-prolyl cis-trans isomerase